jgi:hypothetical protein
MINNGQWSIMFNVVISCDLRVGPPADDGLVLDTSLNGGRNLL